MELQAEISAHRLEAKLDAVMSVLVDEVNEEGAIARSAADAPDIDGLVHIPNGLHLKVGEFTKVRITDVDVHDLFAELV